MVTLSDVAARAGVSVSAVSRVLSDAPSARVSAETRQRIHEVAAELGYRPNFAARALKSSRSGFIGLIVPDLTNAMFTQLVSGVGDEAHAQEYQVLLSRIEDMPDPDETIARMVGEARVDGLLVQVGDRMRPQDLAGLLAADLPVVLINSVHSERAGSVVLDDARGAELGTDHLIELGHTRIALVNGLPPSDTARRRELGFRTAMERARLDVAEEHVTRLGYEPRTGADAMAQLAKLDDLPTAIFVANVNAAHGVLRQAHLLGLRVPEDISVIAMHDTWTAEMTWPPLTTVRMPLYELGRTAMRALKERMDAGKAVDLVVDEPEPVLMMRESTAAVPLRSSDQ